MKKIKILCLDIEGGHGGSSKSLFYLLQKINKKKFKIEVICKKDSWLKEKYHKENIKCIIDQSMPRAIILQKISRNFFSLIFFIIYVWPKSKRFRLHLLQKLKNIDILHCNHISLFLLAFWIKKKLPKLKITFHIRTMFWPYKKNNWHFFYKWTLKITNKICDHFIFITENEKKNFLQILKQKVTGTVIYNPVFNTIKKIENKKKNQSLNIVSLSNHEFLSGTDRIIEVAKLIPVNIQKKFKFLMIGSTIAHKSFFERILKKTPVKKNLIKYAQHSNISHMFKFYGHINNPLPIIKKGDLLIKLTRELNPWGRDILEAMSVGTPVISCGTYNKFVKSNITGFLQKKFNANEVAKWIIKVEKNRLFLDKMKKNSLNNIAKICNQKKQVEKIEKIWIKLNN